MNDPEQIPIAYTGPRYPRPSFGFGHIIAVNDEIGSTRIVRYERGMGGSRGFYGCDGMPVDARTWRHATTEEAEAYEALRREFDAGETT